LVRNSVTYFMDGSLLSRFSLYHCTCILSHSHSFDSLFLTFTH